MGRDDQLGCTDNVQADSRGQAPVLCDRGLRLVIEVVYSVKLSDRTQEWDIYFSVRLSYEVR